jgi:TPR repeat protein
MENTDVTDITNVTNVTDIDKKKSVIYEPELIKISFSNDNKDISENENENENENDCVKEFNGYEELFEFIRSEFFHKTQTFAKICEYANDNDDYTILGYMRLIGRYFKQDYDHAHTTFVIAARNECPYAISFLGFMTLHGLGCEKDQLGGKYLLEYALKLSGRKNSLALINLAEIYHEGLGVDKNETKRIELLKEAMNLNNTFAKCDFATTCDDKDEGIKILRSALNQDKKNMLISHYFARCFRSIDELKKVRVSYYEYWCQCIKDGHLIPQVVTTNESSLESRPEPEPVTETKSKIVEQPRYQEAISQGYTIHYKKDVLVSNSLEEKQKSTQPTQLTQPTQPMKTVCDTNGVLVTCSSNVKGKIRVCLGKNMDEI